MAAIDIGPGATDRSYYWDIVGKTVIDLANSANATGTITSFEFFFAIAGTEVKIGTFSGSGTDYDDRDYETIGNVAAASKQTFSGLNCDVTIGDFIGVYVTTGTIELDQTGGSGVYFIAENTFGQGVHTYTSVGDWTISIYGIGTTPVVAPTVTTQAVTAVLDTTATGNGTITDDGGETPSAWGVCVCLATHSDTPDTGDTVFAGSGTGTEAPFTASITGLTAGILYHCRAYVTNTNSTAYGALKRFCMRPTATTPLGLAALATETCTATRVAASPLGLSVSASKVFTGTKLAPLTLGLIVSATRGLATATRNAAVTMGLNLDAWTDYWDTFCELTLGLAVSATRGIAEATRQAAVALGQSVSAARTQTVTRVSGLTQGLAVSASKIFEGSKTASLVTGLVVSATKGISEAYRYSVNALGLAITASHSRSFTSAVTLGLSISASRAFETIRSASVTLGLLVSASRGIAEATRQSAISLGLAISAAHSRAFTSLLALGLAVSASRSFVSSVGSSVVSALSISASKGLSICSRYSTRTLAGLISAFKTAEATRSSSKTLGLSVSASRVVTLSRTASLTIGSVISAVYSYFSQKEVTIVLDTSAGDMDIVLSIEGGGF